MPPRAQRQGRRLLVTLAFLAAFAIASFVTLWLLDHFLLDGARGSREATLRQPVGSDAEALWVSFTVRKGYVPHATIAAIRDEMLAIRSKDFWEVVDRGTNFDYLSEERKERLRHFFAEFACLGAPAAAPRQDR